MEGQKQLWNVPLKKDTWLSRKPWLLIGFSAASLSLDGSVSRELRTSNDFEGLNRVIASGVSDVVLASFPVALLVAGKLGQNEGIAQYGWKSGEAVVSAFLVSKTLKLSTQRSRPHTEDELGFWDGGNAFPSGHATVAWSLAATTANHFRDKPWVPWIVYPVAGLVSFSRVSSGNHFVSDAVVGSVLGFVIGHYVVH